MDFQQHTRKWLENTDCFRTYENPTGTRTGIVIVWVYSPKVFPDKPQKLTNNTYLTSQPSNPDNITWFWQLTGKSPLRKFFFIQILTNATPPIGNPPNPRNSPRKGFPDNFCGLSTVCPRALNKRNVNLWQVEIMLCQRLIKCKMSCRSSVNIDLLFQLSIG